MTNKRAISSNSNSSANENRGLKTNPELVAFLERLFKEAKSSNAQHLTSTYGKVSNHLFLSIKLKI